MITANGRRLKIIAHNKAQFDTEALAKASIQMAEHLSKQPRDKISRS